MFNRQEMYELISDKCSNTRIIDLVLLELDQDPDCDIFPVEVLENLETVIAEVKRNSEKLLSTGDIEKPQGLGHNVMSQIPKNAVSLSTERLKGQGITVTPDVFYYLLEQELINSLETANSIADFSERVFYSQINRRKSEFSENIQAEVEKQAGDRKLAQKVAEAIVDSQFSFQHSPISSGEEFLKKIKPVINEYRSSIKSVSSVKSKTIDIEAFLAQWSDSDEE